MPRRTSPARALLLAASCLGLVVAGLAAGAIGPWSGQPRGGGSGSLAPEPAPTVPVRPLPRPPDLPQPAGKQGDLGGLLGKIVIIALIVIALGLAVWFITRAVTGVLADRRRTGGPPILRDQLLVPEGLRDPDPESSVPREFDPRAAADEIIACWAGFEQAAAAHGLARRPAQTPTEFVEMLSRERAAEPSADMTEAAALLLRLYQRARFDQHELGPDSAAQARRAARQVAGLVDA